MRLLAAQAFGDWAASMPVPATVLVFQAKQSFMAAAHLDFSIILPVIRLPGTRRRITLRRIKGELAEARFLTGERFSRDNVRYVPRSSGSTISSFRPNALERSGRLRASRVTLSFGRSRQMEIVSGPSRVVTASLRGELLEPCRPDLIASGRPPLYPAMPGWARDISRLTSSRASFGFCRQGQLPGEVVQSLDVLLVRPQRPTVDRFGFGVVALRDAQVRPVSCSRRVVGLLDGPSPGARLPLSDVGNR